MTTTEPPAPRAGSEPAGAAEGALQEASAAKPDQDPGALQYVLTLYVASLTPRSVRAIQSVKDVCERHLNGHYRLEVVDIYERPSVAKRDQILAAPTLIKRLPLPLRRMIGDMADEHRVLVGLDLRAKEYAINPHD
jgi:circadian clock protein KaiB